MIINTDHRGRTASGRMTWRPLVELEDDDYPPDSKYWHLAAIEKCKELCAMMGSVEAYHAWWDPQPEPEHWRAIYELVSAKIKELRAGSVTCEQSNPPKEVNG